MQPLVSVLMTAFNREKYIADAIESVLASTYEQFELIVVDDCSSDRTVEIARSFETKNKRVRVYVNEKNLGDYPNRNKAASYANGKYIKYLDSDDLMYPHCLQVMVNAMELFPDAGYGLSCIGDPIHPYPISISPHDAYWEHFNGYGHFNRAPGSAILKRNIFEAVGQFTAQRHVGDIDMWFKLSLKFNLVKFPVDLYWARSHNQQEAVIESKNKEFKKVRDELLIFYLNHQDNPLSQTEKKRIFQVLSRKILKNKLIKLIR